MKAPKKPVNKTAEAFKEPANAISLAGAFAASLALLNPVPLLAAVVAEAAYLLFVPDSKWFDRRLSEKYDAEVVRRREELKAKVFPTLSGEVQARFGRLEVLRGQMAQQSFEGKRFYREVLRKMDYLMEKFLLFASKQVQFQNYLRTVLQEVDASYSSDPTPPPIRSTSSRKPATRPRFEEAGDEADWVRKTVETIQADYDHEIATIDENRTKGENLHNQAILDKRREVLTRRKQYVARIGEILDNLGHQLQLMEDTFGLISDEIRARSPEQVLADVDDVVFQTDNLTETLQDIAPFEQMTVNA